MSEKADTARELLALLESVLLHKGKTVTVMSFSLGALFASKLARELNAAGVATAGVILVDPSLYDAIPEYSEGGMPDLVLRLVASSLLDPD